MYHRIAIQPLTMGNKAQQTLNQTFSPTFNGPPRGYLLIVSKLKIYQHREYASPFHKVVKSYLIHKASKKAIDREIMRKERGYNLQYLDITATTEKFLNHIDELGICSNSLLYPFNQV